MNAALTCTDTADDTLTVALSGDWLLGRTLPGIEPILARLRAARPPGALRRSCA